MTPIQREHIDLIRKSAGGALFPQDILNDARNPNSPLHPMFTWDDTEAANAFRLIQAKAVIRVAVRFTGPLHVESKRARVTIAAPEVTQEQQQTNKEDELRAKIIRMDIRDARLAVSIREMELERKWLWDAGKELRKELAPEQSAYVEAEAYALCQFMRGVPMANIIIMTRDVYEMDNFSEQDVHTLREEFNVGRPSGWKPEMADAEWQDDVDGERLDGAFGIPPYQPPRHFAGSDRPQGGSLRRFTAYTHKESPPDREAASLRSDHPALTENRTQFPSRVFDADEGDHIFVSGHSNAKIGAFVTKGPWRGLDIFTLTLEERATCPDSCHLLAECYGNALPLAKRRAYTPELVERMDTELREMARERPAGFVVRLHVLGDFPDLGYVQRWSNWMAEIPQIHVFGYTAHLADSPIGILLREMNDEFLGRWAIRFSVAPEVEIDAMQATTIWREDRGRVAEGLVCPASSGDTEACGTCGLCWSPVASGWRIVFLGHGMSRRGRAKGIDTNYTPVHGPTDRPTEIRHISDVEIPVTEQNQQLNDVHEPGETGQSKSGLADHDDPAPEGAAPFDPFVQAGSSDSRTGPATTVDLARLGERYQLSTKPRPQSPPRSSHLQSVRR